MRVTDQSTALQEETSFHMTKLNSNATKGETLWKSVIRDANSPN